MSTTMSTVEADRDVDDTVEEQAKTFIRADASVLRTAPSSRSLRHYSHSRYLVLVLLLSAGLGVAAWGWRWWTVGRFIETTDDAYVRGEITLIAPKIAGLVSSVYVTDNQRVHVGDVLVRINDREYRAQLAKAAAAVSEKEATLANLDAARYLQEAIIDQARADLTAAVTENARAKGDADRYRHLAADRNASEQRAQQANAEYEKAVATQWRATAAVDAAKRYLAVIDSQKTQVQAALSAAIAERELAALNLEYTEIRAPIDGLIGNRVVRLGAYASVGVPLLAIVPEKNLWVEANFKESQLARVRAGQHATLMTDEFGDEVFTGIVDSLAPATGSEFALLPPENATGNFTKIVQRVPIRILLNYGAAEERLRPGLSVMVEVDVRTISEPTGHE
jgi:membrane fusion protein (multidrug efflux system)